MTSEYQRCKIVALLKSLKNIYVLIFWIHIPESIFTSNKHIYKIRHKSFWYLIFDIEFLSCMASGYFHFIKIVKVLFYLQSEKTWVFVLQN